MKRLHLFPLVCLLLLLCACAQQRAACSFFAMDTLMQLEGYGSAAQAALDDAQAEVYRLEGLFSCQNPDAELARVNAGGGADLSADTAALIRTALELSAVTGGAYDPTLYPLSLAWGFSGGQMHVPEHAQLQALLAQTGTQLVALDGSRVTLENGAQLDLGGIAKGYTAGRIRSILTGSGVRSAIVSLGGNVAAIGTKPDGSAWRVGLQDPDNPDAYFGVVSVQDACVVTSGDYQRCFEEDGVRYCHILDPKTGYPARSGLRSVSVLSEDDTLADALSTALFVMGADAGAEFYKTSGLRFEAVFVTDGGEILITPGLSGVYQSDRPYRVLDA